jgi:hypothetical protein
LLFDLVKDESPTMRRAVADFLAAYQSLPPLPKGELGTPAWLSRILPYLDPVWSKEFAKPSPPSVSLYLTPSDFRAGKDKDKAAAKEPPLADKKEKKTPPSKFQIALVKGGAVARLRQLRDSETDATVRDALGRALKNWIVLEKKASQKSDP